MNWWRGTIQTIKGNNLLIKEYMSEYEGYDPINEGVHIELLSVIKNWRRCMLWIIKRKPIITKM